MKSYRLTLSSLAASCTLLVRAHTLDEVCGRFEPLVPQGWTLTIEVMQS